MLFHLVHFSPERINDTEYQVRWSNSDAEQTVEVLIYPPGGEAPQPAIRLASRPYRNGQGTIADHPPRDGVLDFPCPDPPVKAVLVNARQAVIRLDDDTQIALAKAG